MRLHTRYHDLGRGVKSYDVVATFTPPDISAYDTAEAWYRVSGTEEWKYGGSGTGEIAISGCELGARYDVRVQVKDIHGHFSQGVEGQILVVMKAEIPNMPRGFSVTFGDKAYFNWLEVTNADVDFYELRFDQAPGTAAGLIGRSNNTTYAGMLQDRKGKVFLYAHNPDKGYSAPATVEYNVPIPPQPQNLVAKPGLEGISVSAPPIPPGCKGINVYIDDTVVFSASNAFFIPTEGGVHEISAAYCDIFGEGKRTVPILVTVEITIPHVLKEAEEASKKKVDEALSGLDERIKAGTEKVIQTEIQGEIDGISSRVAQLSDTIDTKIADKIKGVETHITQLSDTIETRVTEAVDGLDGEKIVSRINQTSKTITLDSKYLHITGQTQIDSDVIAKNLQAGSISADKIRADKLSSISANMGTVTAGTIKGIDIIGCNISADSLYQSGYKIKNIDIKFIDVPCMQKIQYPWGVDEGDCIAIYAGRGKQYDVCFLDPNTLPRSDKYTDELIRYHQECIRKSGIEAPGNTDYISGDGTVFSGSWKFYERKYDAKGGIMTLIEIYYARIALLIIRR